MDNSSLRFVDFQVMFDNDSRQFSGVGSVNQVLELFQEYSDTLKPSDSVFDIYYTFEAVDTFYDYEPIRFYGYYFGKPSGLIHLLQRLIEILSSKVLNHGVMRHVADCGVIYDVFGSNIVFRYASNLPTDKDLSKSGTDWDIHDILFSVTPFYRHIKFKWGTIEDDYGHFSLFYKKNPKAFVRFLQSLASNGLNTNNVTVNSGFEMFGRVPYIKTGYLKESVKLSSDTITSKALRVSGAGGERDTEHPLAQFSKISQIFSIMFDLEHKPLTVFTPMHFAVLMEILKTVREASKPNPDNWTDFMGYANCVSDIDVMMKNLGYGGYDALWTMNLTDIQRVFNEFRAFKSKPKDE